MNLKNYKSGFLAQICVLGALTMGVTSAYAYSNKPDDSLYADTGLTWHKYQLSKKARHSSFNGRPMYKDDNMGMNLIAGKRFGNFGAELGYTILDTQQFHGTTYIDGNKIKRKSTHDNSNFFFDVNSYIDLYTNLEFRTAVGVGVLLTKTRDNWFDHKHRRVLPEHRNSEAELKPRIGAGLQYNISKEWSTNLDLRYQFGNQYYKTMTATALNLTYRF